MGRKPKAAKVAERGMAANVMWIMHIYVIACNGKRGKLLLALLLIACNEVVISEGRELKATGKEEIGGHVSHGGGHSHGYDLPAAPPDDFSVTRKKDKDRHTLPTVRVDRRLGSDDTNEEDFKPEPPSNNPGVRHYDDHGYDDLPAAPPDDLSLTGKKDKDRHTLPTTRLDRRLGSNDTNEEDFKTEPPSNNPGVRHYDDHGYDDLPAAPSDDLSLTGKKDEDRHTLPTTTRVDRRLGTDDTNEEDFKPEPPSYSPGVRHYDDHGGAGGEEQQP